MKENNIKEDINYEDNFLKSTTFQKVMAEGKKEFPIAIFICRLNPKNKKIHTTKDIVINLLSKVKKQISEKYDYLLDEDKNFKIIKINMGFHIPVKNDDLKELLLLLDSAKKELFDHEKISLFIDLSHKSLNSDINFIKVQFKNIPPNIDKNLGKKIFSEFGEIQDLYHKDGIWTIIYSKILWYLPYKFNKHLEISPKNRWFMVSDALCSFSSKSPCSLCKIKGHSTLNCPGESLISKLDKKNTKIGKPKNLIETKNDSSEDLLVSIDSDPKTPIGNQKNKDTAKSNVIPSTKKKKKKYKK
jgi:RNAse (barnase) inhibitor barstar